MRILVFTTCYNEKDNIGRLIDQIAAIVPMADILVVDDNSPDGTFEVIEAKSRQYPQVTCLRRPGKLGIGSAHKYGLFYAMREGYDVVVTMDADLSHDPRFVPDLLRACGPEAFVTGSRYCAGGSSSYRGYRAFVSRAGNAVARRLLGLRIEELTTYFRAFDVASLRRVPFRYVDADGYNFGLQLVHYLARSGIELREVPIEFPDRAHGVSKIPKLQILMSVWALGRLALDRWRPRNGPLAADLYINEQCAACGQRMLATHSKRLGKPGDTAKAVTLKCLHCGHLSDHLL